MDLPAGIVRPNDLGPEVHIRELVVGNEYYVYSRIGDRFAKSRIRRIDTNNNGEPQYIVFEEGPFAVFGVGMAQIGARNNEEYERELHRLFRFYEILNPGNVKRPRENNMNNNPPKRVRLNRRRKSRKSTRKTRRSK